MKLTQTKLISGVACLFAAAFGLATEAFAKEVVVYSARKEHLIKPLFDRYTEKTGVNVKYITDKAGPLLARLKAEGENTPADILLTVDAGNLWQAANEGILSAVESEALQKNIPSHLRDINNQWFGLSVRARTIVYRKDKVDPDSLTSYEALSNEQWKGRLCLRTAKKVYNQSMVAMMVARLGERKTEQIVTGWVDNLATDVFSSDTQLLKAMTAGQCDVGIVNTYYLGRLQKKDPSLPLAVFWPNQTDRGTHVNVSGAGVTKHAKNRDEAVKLIEWLSSQEAQKDFAALNLEYPVNSDIDVDPLVKAWGAFKADKLHVAEAGRLQTTAVKLMDRAGYH